MDSFSITPVVTEWIAKAEGDYRTMGREFRVVEDPNCDLICSEAQQCVEKYLKAYLTALDIYFPKTHNLLHLLDLLSPAPQELLAIRDDLRKLSEFAVMYRYPGISASRQEVQSAVDTCFKARNILRRCLRLDSDSLFS
jgi:HEPN domain-containing protein